MRYRLATIGDIPGIVRLYEIHLRENARAYPRVGPHPDADFANYLGFQMSQNTANAFSIVAEATDLGAVQGVLLNVINRRFLEHPQVYGYMEFLAVTPAARRHGVANKLAKIGFKEFVKRGITTVECGWAPGSTAEALWLAVGVRPYNTVGAWVDADGEPRTDLPVIPSGVKVEPAISVPVAEPPEEPNDDDSRE